MCLWRLAFALCALVRLAINVAPPMAAAAAKLALVPVLEEAAGVAGAGLAVLPRWGCNWRAAPGATKAALLSIRAPAPKAKVDAAPVRRLDRPDILLKTAIGAICEN
mmetsp:Transcript_79624/g.161948  ORF Transcript_79624/g.161948 Transcript_79624/m.161948 type:complete len:107 (-) Transcript_79624:47-367(-)